MLMFLATVLEQLDLAQEHLAKGDVHNARFGLMMTDNALELVLHRIARDKAAYIKAYSYMSKDYEHTAALQDALGRSFDAKVKFAKLEGHLTPEDAQTVTILHDFRNVVYHIGLQHGAILPELAAFYFDLVCTILSRFGPGALGGARMSGYLSERKSTSRGTTLSQAALRILVMHV
jgi:hypothetical protein